MRGFLVKLGVGLRAKSALVGDWPPARSLTTHGIAAEEAQASASLVTVTANSMIDSWPLSWPVNHLPFVSLGGPNQLYRA